MFDIKAFHSIRRIFFLAALALCCITVSAQEDIIRRHISERYPTLPKIDEISKTPVDGIYEIRLGNELIYTDSRADFIFQGILIDSKTQKNLTESKKEDLRRIEFSTIPLEGTFKRTQGTGARQLAIFVDPNCGYCKQLEKNLEELKDVTIHFILLPVLGDDSYNKSQHVWCAKDKDAVWKNWMLSGIVPPAANCNIEAISSNLKFAQLHRVTGTPTMILGNGRRIAGAIPMAQLDKILNETR